MPNGLLRQEGLLATSMKSEFWLDKYSELEQVLDEMDDDLLDIIQLQIIAFKTWYANHYQKHNKGQIAYELLSQIIDE
jgi:hypothetical protein